MKLVRQLVAWSRSRITTQARLTHTKTGTDQPSPILNRLISQPTCFSHPHQLTADQITPGISRAEYLSRRAQLAKALPENSLSIFPSNPQTFMTEDVPYLYHHNTDLMYITGIAEPGACLVAHRTTSSTDYILFVRERDPTHELWDGPRCGASHDVRDYFAVHDVRHITDLPSYISAALPNLKTFHFDSTINNSVSTHLARLDAPQLETLRNIWRQAQSPKSFLLPLRLHKSSAEISLLRSSAGIMATSLNDAMASSHVSGSESVTERHIDGMLQFGCKTRGATNMAFPSVVASGFNATVLHYMDNNSTAVAGDFVMVDAGCELHGYCSDVSRSWPVSGSFSGAQRDFYELVLTVQKECIELAREGLVLGTAPISLDRMHEVATRNLTDGLLQLGFLKEHSLESALTTGAYGKYFPHATGHYLGMDVHDTHTLSKSLPLVAGMVITVEPGLYCGVDDNSAPEAFRGLGMRIEDDVVVGDAKTAPEVLSANAVKEVTEVEALVRSGRMKL